jgi:hypothetical protein
MRSTEVTVAVPPDPSDTVTGRTGSPGVAPAGTALVARRYSDELQPATTIQVAKTTVARWRKELLRCCTTGAHLSVG